HFLASTADPRREPAAYRDAVLRLMRRRAAFLFAGDFSDAVHDWHDPARRRAWRHTLGLFRQWGLSRPLLITRINHSFETDAPPPDVGAAAQAPSMWDDGLWWEDGRDDRLLRVEDTTDEGGFAERRPSLSSYGAYLVRQRAWAVELSRALHGACRGYLPVDD